MICRFNAVLLALFLSLAPSWAQMGQIPAYVQPAPSGAPSTAWDPTFNSNGAYSNGNLTWDQTIGFSFNLFRGVATHSTGKFYYEITVVAAPSLPSNGNLIGIGIANSLANSSGNIGGGGNAAGVTGTGGVYVNGSSIGTLLTTWTAGNVICLAMDFTNGEMWVRQNAGNWNGSGTANPATNTGGVSLSSMGGPYFPAGNTASTGDTFTANFGATAYAQTAPSGFGNW